MKNVCGNLNSWKYMRFLTGVRAEYLDAGERRDHPDPEADHIRDGGDGDGDGGVPEALGHPLGDWGLGGGAPPGPQHHKGVVNANAYETYGFIRCILCRKFKVTEPHL